MSSDVCQGLESCLEPRLVEPLVLRPKLAPPESNFSPFSPWPQALSPLPSPQHHHHHHNNNGDLGGWSFIQSLTDISQNNCKEMKDKTEKVYVHPLAKSSSSALSKKISLEMCTESLGTETGSDISDSSDEFSSLSLENEKSGAAVHHEQRSKSRPQFAKKLSRSGTFPPPLTSISGSGSGLRVSPHREGGRLVLKAVTVSSSGATFQAERADGRLRLCLVENTSSLNCHNVEAEGEHYDHDDNEEEEGEGEGGGGKVGVEIEIGEAPRPSRCKEGGRPGGNNNKGINCSWGPFWVAIS